MSPHARCPRRCGASPIRELPQREIAQPQLRAVTPQVRTIEIPAPPAPTAAAATAPSPARSRRRRPAASSSAPPSPSTAPATIEAGRSRRGHRWRRAETGGDAGRPAHAFEGGRLGRLHSQPARWPARRARRRVQRRRQRAARRCAGLGITRPAAGHHRRPHHQPRSRRYVAQAQAQRLRADHVRPILAPERNPARGMGAQERHDRADSDSRAPTSTSSARPCCWRWAGGATSPIPTSTNSPRRRAHRPISRSSRNCRKTTAASGRRGRLDKPCAVRRLCGGRVPAGRFPDVAGTTKKPASLRAFR